MCILMSHFGSRLFGSRCQAIPKALVSRLWTTHRELRWSVAIWKLVRKMSGETLARQAGRPTIESQADPHGLARQASRPTIHSQADARRATHSRNTYRNSRATNDSKESASMSRTSSATTSTAGSATLANIRGSVVAFGKAGTAAVWATRDILDDKLNPAGSGSPWWADKDMHFSRRWIA